MRSQNTGIADEVDHEQERRSVAGSPSDRLLGIFQDFAAAEYDKQLALREVLGEHTWTFDWAQGILTWSRSTESGASSRHSCPVQVLGVEQYRTRSWVWSWQELAQRLPDRALRLARFLQGIGERRGIEEFRKPILAAAGLFPHQLSMTASGLFQADGYYRAGFGGGAVHLLLRDPLFRRRVSDPIARAAAVFPRFVRTFPVPSHRRAFLAYAAFLGLAPREEGRFVFAAAPDESILWVEFDREDRFQRMLTQVGGSDRISPARDPLRESA